MQSTRMVGAGVSDEVSHRNSTTAASTRHSVPSAYPEESRWCDDPRTRSRSQRKVRGGASVRCATNSSGSSNPSMHPTMYCPAADATMLVLRVGLSPCDARVIPSCRRGLGSSSFPRQIAARSRRILCDPPISAFPAKHVLRVPETTLSESAYRGTWSAGIGQCGFPLLQKMPTRVH
jgi:hypothetical protein